MTSFTARAAAAGFAAGTRVLSAERVRADAEAASRLGLRPGGSVYRIQRLRLADDTPIAVETARRSAIRFAGLIKPLRHSQSLYQVLEQVYGVVPVSAEDTIQTAPASPREADLLHTDTGTPMLLLARHSFDAHGTPVEWTHGCYRGDRYLLLARLTAPTDPHGIHPSALQTAARRRARPCYITP